ncbi:MAG: hypothetical protein KBF88_00345 [Polyangiaceae bacterium]|nr:hypothetical protein [Polyangiaceae bacterium]
MRYLYGDSAPFPHTFNFLSTVEGFLTAATRSVQLESESRALEVNAASAAAGRLRGMDELQAFHEAVVRAIQDSGSKRTSPVSAEYVRNMVDHADQRVVAAKMSVESANEREQAQVRMEVDRRRSEMRLALEAFLLSSKLPVVSSAYTLTLDNTVYRGTTAVTYPDSIQADYAIAPSKVVGWQAPKKVGDLLQGLTLNVGVKKGLFRKGIQFEAMAIDDYLVSSLSLSETTARVHFRRSLKEPKDCLEIEIRKSDSGLAGVYSFPQEEPAEGGEVHAGGDDLMNLSRLLDAITKALSELGEYKERVLSLKLEDEDVFENDLGIVFIERIVKLLAPTFGEVVKRSPNATEFSLKVETDSGRREEIYVRKDDLVSKIAPLGDKERAIFAAFNLVPPDLPSTQSAEINLNDLDDEL